MAEESGEVEISRCFADCCKVQRVELVTDASMFGASVFLRKIQLRDILSVSEPNGFAYTTV